MCSLGCTEWVAQNGKPRCLSTGTTLLVASHQPWERQARAEWLRAHWVLHCHPVQPRVPLPEGLLGTVLSSCAAWGSPYSSSCWQRDLFYVCSLLHSYPASVLFKLPISETRHAGDTPLWNTGVWLAGTPDDEESPPLPFSIRGLGMLGHP